MMKPATGSMRFTLMALAIAFTSVLLAISIFLRAYGEPVSLRKRAFGSGTYSTSALGYAGLYHTLERLDRPVIRGRGRVLSAVVADGTLVVAEPDISRMANGATGSLLSARRLLLVLPKWGGEPDEERSAWIARAWPLPPNIPGQTLSLVSVTPSKIVRIPWPGPGKWESGEIGVAPVGDGHVQLMRSEGMRSVVGTDEGILVGEITAGNRKIWILSDPDTISNHGIVKGDNVLFALSLLDALRFWENTDVAAPIVFDETVHGFREEEKSPEALFFRFPFVIVTFLLCCTFSLFIWAGAGRFGRPSVPKPELDFGKSGLISNAVRLLDYSGHHTAVLRRYIAMTLRDAGESMHLSPTLGEMELAEELDRIAESRGLDALCVSLLESVSAAGSGDSSVQTLFRCARKIYDWKGVLLDGSSVDRRNRQVDKE